MRAVETLEELARRHETPNRQAWGGPKRGRHRDAPIHAETIQRKLEDIEASQRRRREFHETVVEAIREESPETARRIVVKLKERRALRPNVELPTLTGGPDGDVA